MVNRCPATAPAWRLVLQQHPIHPQSGQTAFKPASTMFLYPGNYQPDDRLCLRLVLPMFLHQQNLPKNLTEEELRALFSPYGAVIECRVLHSGTARTDSGTGAGALVRMASVDEAAQAIAHLHNQRLAGSVMPLVVRFADTQVRILVPLQTCHVCCTCAVWCRTLESLCPLSTCF